MPSTLTFKVKGKDLNKYLNRMVDGKAIDSFLGSSREHSTTIVHKKDYVVITVVWRTSYVTTKSMCQRLTHLLVDRNEYALEFLPSRRGHV